MIHVKQQFSYLQGLSNRFEMKTKVHFFTKSQKNVLSIFWNLTTKCMRISKQLLAVSEIILWLYKYWVQKSKNYIGSDSGS